MPSRAVAFGAVIALVIAVLAAAVIVAVSPTRHVSGGGPLLGVDSWAMGLDPSPVGRWSLGILLCSMTGDEIVIEAMKPKGVVGEARFLGALVRQFQPTSGNLPITSMHGYPPDVPDQLFEPRGFVVSAGCSLPEREHVRTESLWGIESVGSGGGGWTAEEIEYRVGARRYVLELDVGMFVCGPAAPAQYCEPPQ